ncbi:hypothetical protein KBB27_01060 [Patescibacteria group bacterium]|nr:hypothetical protein [Patescibacteria group bacterium]
MSDTAHRLLTPVYAVRGVVLCISSNVRAFDTDPVIGPKVLDAEELLATIVREMERKMPIQGKISLQLKDGIHRLISSGATNVSSNDRRLVPCCENTPQEERARFDHTPAQQGATYGVWVSSVARYLADRRHDAPSDERARFEVVGCTHVLTRLEALGASSPVPLIPVSDPLLPL